MNNPRYPLELFLRVITISLKTMKIVRALPNLEILDKLRTEMGAEVKQRSAEWFKARCGRITGSRFAKAMSARNTRAYQKLIDDLVDERLSGRVNDGYTSPAMQWGIDHEAGARCWYSKAKNRPVKQIGFVVHPEFEFVGVSPDGLVGADGLVEIKCPQLANFERVANSRSLPASYRWQIQGQLWVCRRQWLDFVCFYPPDKGVIVPVAFDSVDGNRLADRCLEINTEVERRLRARTNRSTRNTEVNRSALTSASPRPGGQYSGRDTQSYDSKSSASKVRAIWWFWLVIVAVVLVLKNC